MVHGIWYVDLKDRSIHLSDVIEGHKGRRYFIAGGSGLLGIHLALKLEEQGADFRASYFLHSPGILKEKFEKFDFLNFQECIRATSGVTDLILCAGKTFGVKTMKENPTVASLPNLQIACNLLEAAYHSGVERTVFISTATVYQEFNRPIRETDLDLNIRPYDLYLGVGNVARYLEQLCFFYHKQYGMKIGIVRPSNFYGPYDHFEEGRSHVLPALIRRASQKEVPFRVWGDGTAVRDFIFVRDAAEAILKVLDRYCVCDPLNLGSGEAVSVQKAVETVLEICGHKVEAFYDKSLPSAIPYRVLDMTKSRQILGDLGATSLKEGIQQTFEWYRAKIKGKRYSQRKSSGVQTLVTGIASGLGKQIHGTFRGEGLARENAEDVLGRAAHFGTEIIMHAAFNSRREVNASDLHGYYEDNILLTQKLVKVPHRKFIYISSIDVYPKNGREHTEDEAISLNSVGGIYAATKLMAESLVMRHCPNFLILRCSAFLGAHSRKANLKIIAEDKDPVLTLTADSQFNYVLHADILDFLQFAIAEDLQGIYNVASSENISLGEVAEMLKKKVRFGDFRYETGKISNGKILAVSRAFRKTSKEVVAEFLREAYALKGTS